MESTRRNKFFAVGLLAVLLSGGAQQSAEAACAVTDLRGTWYAIGTIGNSRLNGFEEYIRCKIVLSSTGAVTASGSSCVGRDDVGRFTVNITGGSVRVSTACAITGSITFYAGTPLRHTIEFGQMERGKNIFTFASYQSTNPDDLTLFTAIKQ